jgi:hypothetical protein
MKIKVNDLWLVTWINPFDNTPSVYPKLYTSYDEAKKCAEELGSNDFFVKRVFI